MGNRRARSTVKGVCGTGDRRLRIQEAEVAVIRVRDVPTAQWFWRILMRRVLGSLAVLFVILLVSSSVHRYADPALLDSHHPRNTLTWLPAAAGTNVDAPPWVDHGEPAPAQDQGAGHRDSGSRNSGWEPAPPPTTAVRSRPTAAAAQRHVGTNEVRMPWWHRQVFLRLGRLRPQHAPSLTVARSTTWCWRGPGPSMAPTLRLGPTSLARVRGRGGSVTTEAGRPRRRRRTAFQVSPTFSVDAHVSKLTRALPHPSAGLRLGDIGSTSSLT
jgi:hypothetical protein